MTMTREQQRLRSVWQSALPRQQLDELRRDPRLAWAWYLWARDEQLPPPGDWTYWLILAGRGFGKTRTGAEWVREQVKTSNYVNLIGATADDARDIMIEGESGILAICPTRERPEYKSSQRKLVWPNGATSLIFTADEPERLRGKQHSRLWCDEVAAWRYAEAWDQAKFGLRLGNAPRACLTTTPKPSTLIKSIIADPAAVTTRGSTYDNQDNLAPAFFDSIISTYEGTRLGRQELNAELLEDNPGALWSLANIDQHRMQMAPDMTRIVVGVDPAVTANEHSDETGIIVAGIDAYHHVYILADRSIVATPEIWGREVIRAYRDFWADRVIAEVNNGGDLVESLLRGIDRNLSYMHVRASRGKALRAEPVAALYEQGRVHHIGRLDALEDQMCAYNPLDTTRKCSPDRMDALVWAVTHLAISGSALAF